MFTLLKFSKDQATKGIYHTRRNGDFVQELFKKDAVLVYEVTEYNNRFSEKYAFFIIECDEFDNLRCGKAAQTVTKSLSDFDIFYDAVDVSEMCRELLKQEKPFPSNLENLLSDYLPRFFSTVHSWGSEFNSADTWYFYEWILEKLGKKANDFVKQSAIDSFFSQMCDIHDVWQISRMLPSNVLNISPDVSMAIEQSIKELQETIEIAKGLIAQKSYKDIKYSSFDYIPSVSMQAKDTPCGNIGVFINLLYGFSVSIEMDNSHGYAKGDITNECKEFERNFKRKH